MEVADDFWAGIDARADLHAGRLVIVFRRPPYTGTPSITL